MNSKYKKISTSSKIVIRPIIINHYPYPQSDDLHVNIFSDILKLNRDELRKWLITRQIESINDTVLIPQSKAQSEAARDALAKHIYAEMFQYIVHKINRNLAGGKKQNCFIGEY